MSDALDIPSIALRRTKDSQSARIRQAARLFVQRSCTPPTEVRAQDVPAIPSRKDIPYVAVAGDGIRQAGCTRRSSTAWECGKPLPGGNAALQEPLASAYAERGAIAERKMGVTREGRPTGFFDPGVFFRGVIDATIIGATVAGKGTAAFLPDWKTGNSFKYEDPFELECQAVMLHASMPHLTAIAGHYVWLKENRVGVTHNLTEHPPRLGPKSTTRSRRSRTRWPRASGRKTRHRCAVTAV